MEMVLSNGFNELTLDEVMFLDGGRNWVATIAGTIAGGAAIVGGVASIVWAWS